MLKLVDVSKNKRLKLVDFSNREMQNAKKRLQAIAVARRPGIAETYNFMPGARSKSCSAGN